MAGGRREEAEEGEAVRGGRGRVCEEGVGGGGRLVAALGDPNTPYRSRPRPMFVARAGDYDHLARVKEWSSGLGEGA